MAISHWPRRRAAAERSFCPGRDGSVRRRITGYIFAHRIARGHGHRSGQGAADAVWRAGALLRCRPASLLQAKGVGTAKFCQVQATLELTARYLQEQLEGQPMFTSPAQVQDYLSVQMRDYQREVFVVLLLDSPHQLLDIASYFRAL